MKQVRRLSCVLLLFVAVMPTWGVETTFWQVGSFDEFLQGTLTGVSLSKEGNLSLAPDSQAIFSPEEAVALSLARDGRGNLYVGTGHQGKVFRVTPDQKSSPVMTSPEPDIFALAVGPDGNLYVGSSPDGAVYKVGDDGKFNIFYKPKAKYIWALQFDGKGRLYVATGDKGQIFRVDASGKGEVFFDSKQTHVMCLTFDRQGDLLAGSVPNGLIYRLSPEGKAFVIYQSSLPEIHDMAVDSQGNVFAAALGSAGGKGSPEMLLAPPGTNPPAGVTTITVTASTDAAAKGQTPPGESKNPSFNRLSPQASQMPLLQFGSGHGALIQISPDSTVQTLWNSNSESIFGLAIRNDHVLFTTDNTGRIFDLDANPSSPKLMILTETHEAMATRLLLSGSNLYAATSNVAKLFRIGDTPAREGTFESPVKDTKYVSRWGVLAWRGTVSKGSDLQFYTRSGNSDHPDNTWSDWAGPYANPTGNAVTNPPARYIQWKAVFHSGGSSSPTLDEVTLSYLNQNLAPQIHSLNVSTSSERTGLGGAAAPANLPLGVTTGPQAASPSGKPPINLTWQADDPNGDQLVYSLYLRATDEEEWHLLKDKLRQATYAIDPTALADGKYVARLVASDEESNPPEIARKSELLSAPFWVDNTPPDVEVVKQTAAAGVVEVLFSAEDSTSPLRAAETALDSQEWHDILSDDGVVDSRKERFTVKLPHLSAGEHILYLRAADTSGNIGIGKAVIRISGGGK